MEKQERLEDVLAWALARVAAEKTAPMTIKKMVISFVKKLIGR